MLICQRGLFTLMNRTARIFPRSRVLPVLLLLTLAGCSKVTLENYDRLKIGMAFDEVEAIVGEPAGCSEALGARVCRWGNDKKNIKVTFFGSRATLFSAEGLN